MNLIDLQQEWAKDTKLDKTALDEESINIPKLQSKYLNILSTERLLWKKLTRKKEEKIQQLTDYYNGFIDGRDIGREPWQKTETKGSINKRVESDAEVLKIQALIDEKEEIVLFVKEVVTSLNFRNNTIKNTLDFMRWTQGG